MVYPKISYDLTVIDLSSIEDYQFMNFKVGDKIKIENILNKVTKDIY